MATMFIKYNMSERWMSALMDTEITEESSKQLSECQYLESLMFRLGEDVEEDFDEIDSHLGNWGLNGNGIFIMPEGVDRDTICDRLPWLFEACNKRGYNLTTRLHVLAFGDMKGV